MSSSELRKRIIALAGVAVATVFLLTLLWKFGIEDSVRSSLMELGRKDSPDRWLDILAGTIIVLMSLAFPTTLLLKYVAAHTRWVRNELGQAERIYKSIVDSSNDIILRIDPQGIITFTNPAVRLLGYQTADLEGKPVKTLLPPETADEILPRITTKRIGYRSTVNYPISFLTNEDSVLHYENPYTELVVDANGLWAEPDEVVQTVGVGKTFLGTLCIARPKSSSPI